MGVFQYEKRLNDMVLKAEEIKRESQGVKRHVVSKRRSSTFRRPKRIVMKKRRLGGASTSRRNYGIVRRVRTLKRLIPKSESRGLDGLFTDTADYILSLQMRVRVMQIMVNVLSGSEG